MSEAIDRSDAADAARWRLVREWFQLVIVPVPATDGLAAVVLDVTIPDGADPLAADVHGPIGPTGLALRPAAEWPAIEVLVDRLRAQGAGHA